LVKDIEKRYTLNQVLEHAWLKNEKTEKSQKVTLKLFSLESEEINKKKAETQKESTPK